MSERWLVGVDLGGTTTKLAFITGDGEIIRKWEIPTDNREEGKNIITNIANTINQVREELHQDKSNLIGLGMGVPGSVNYATGHAFSITNLPWKDNYPLKSLLEKQTSLPAFIDNDANCAALGEMWKGAGSGAKDLVIVTLGTGVGGGIIANGSVVQGIGGAAGEIGHIVSIPTGGALCNCGKTGCLETIASATGIVRMATEKLSELQHPSGPLFDIFQCNGKLTSRDVVECAKAGDTISLNVMDVMAFHLGIALANVANTLNPEMIVIGGGVSKAGEFLLTKVRHYFDGFAFPRTKMTTEISLATLGNDAGVIGAAKLAKNALNYN